MSTPMPFELIELLRAGDVPEPRRVEVHAALAARGWDTAGSVDLAEPGACRELAAVLVDEPALGGLGGALRASLVAAVEAVDAARFDVVPEVIGRTHGVDVRDLVASAVTFEAGAVDVSDAVDRALGHAARPALAGAVWAAAGPMPDVSDAVLDRVAPELVAPRIASALAAAAGPVDLVDDVLAALGLLSGPNTASAPRGGSAQVADPLILVSGMLDNALSAEERVAATALLSADPLARLAMTDLAAIGRGVRAAVERRRGPTPYVWSAVAAGIGIEDAELVPGWERVPLADAVRRGAGEVDVTATVMSKLQPSAVVADLVVEAPANRVGWSAFAAVAAAAILVLVAVPRLFGAPSAPALSEVPDALASIGGAPAMFAAAGEVNVDEIRSGAKASVFVETPVGSETPLIIWVDDGGSR